MQCANLTQEQKKASMFIHRTFPLCGASRAGSSSSNKLLFLLAWRFHRPPPHSQRNESHRGEKEGGGGRGGGRRTDRKVTYPRYIKRYKEPGIYYSLVCVFSWGIPQLQSDWSLSCDHGLFYASSCENNNNNSLQNSATHGRVFMRPSYNKKYMVQGPPPGSAYVSGERDTL